MNYIVLDLEWNQGDSNKPVPGQPLTFEIIEIGAVKLSADRLMTGEFSELVKPQVFKTMHFMTEKIIHLKMRELKNERPFPEVIKHFLDWCGPDPVFCTWGPLDLYELQRNMEYYNIEPLSDGPFAFYDVQKLFALEYEENNKRVALETAVDMLKIEKDIPFHRAFSDAYYAAKVFSMIRRDDTLRHYSYDVFNPPKDKKSELNLFFGNYDKYISRTFKTKEDLINDKTVKNCNCYICNSKAKRIVKFFSPTGKYFLGLSKCETHGYIKVKVRIRKSEDGRYFTVKTRKLISENDALDIIARAERFKKNKDRIREERR